MLHSDSSLCWHSLKWNTPGMHPIRLWDPIILFRPFCLMSISSDLRSLLYLKLKTDFQPRSIATEPWLVPHLPWAIQKLLIIPSLKSVPFKHEARGNSWVPGEGAYKETVLSVCQHQEWQSQSRAADSVAKESVKRHLKRVNEAALWLSTEFSLSVKGRRKERLKVMVWAFLSNR